MYNYYIYNMTRVEEFIGPALISMRISIEEYDENMIAYSIHL